MVGVNQPTISSFDDSGVEFNYGSPRLLKMFTRLASTGEMEPIDKPEGLQNSTYNVPITVPVARCNVSDEITREGIASAVHDASLYETWLAPKYKDDLIPYTYKNISTNDTTFHLQNLTIDIPQNLFDKVSIVGKVGFFTRLTYGGNDAQPPEIWIAIANPPEEIMHAPKLEGTIPMTTSWSSPYTASYYTCRLRNASVDTTISFTNNVQSVKTSILHEEDLRAPFDDDLFAISSFNRYLSWFGLIYDQLDGFTMVSAIPPPREEGHQEWASSLLNSSTSNGILGTAKDYAAMNDAWSPQIRFPDPSIQDKNLTTLIEEFALNASLSLMAIPELK